jgi:hypothetical protein
VGRERESVGVTEAGGHGRRVGSDRCRRHEVARRLVLEREWHEEIATLDALARLAFDEALGPADPTASGTHLAPRDEDQAHPDGVADCG